MRALESLSSSNMPLQLEKTVTAQVLTDFLYIIVTVNNTLDVKENFTCLDPIVAQTFA